MFELPATPDPYPILADMVKLAEHAHLAPVDGRPSIRFLLRQEPKIRQGRLELGSVHMPKVQGGLKDVFTWMLLREFRAMPDYLVLLDRDFWVSATDRDREILIFHELCHCRQAVNRDGEPRFDEEGNPVWTTVAHDVEEFNATVARYGAYSEEIREFIAAVKT